MAYVENHLLPGEHVMHRAHLHKIIFLVPGMLATMALAIGGVLTYLYQSPIAAGVTLLVVAIPLMWTYVAYTSSEFAITDKRVIIKVGWIRRRTLETMLGKVEGIGVDQTMIGRILDFGTITVTGTGGTKEQFANIAAPLEFRRQVQAQISQVEATRMGAPAGSQLAATGPRDERDCPHCAERILVRARVCKHCGRDVEPLVVT